MRQAGWGSGARAFVDGWQGTSLPHRAVLPTLSRRSLSACCLMRRLHCSVWKKTARERVAAGATAGDNDGAKKRRGKRRGKRSGAPRSPCSHSNPPEVLDGPVEAGLPHQLLRIIALQRGEGASAKEASVGGAGRRAGGGSGGENHMPSVVASAFQSRAWRSYPPVRAANRLAAPSRTLSEACRAACAALDRTRSAAGPASESDGPEQHRRAGGQPFGRVQVATGARAS